MSMIDRDEAIRLIASYPGPVDKSVVRRLLTQMDEVQDESKYWHEKASSYEQTILRLCETRTWIPVTERLPEELEEVNITWVNTDPEPYYDFIKGKPFTGTGVYFKGRWYWYSAVCVDYLNEYGFSPADDMDDAIKVLAWMPLPEPYEGGEQDDQ